MNNETPFRFTLDNDTLVVVKKVTTTKYDFELFFSNGLRKTFVWQTNSPVEFKNRKGYTDEFATAALKKFISIH